MIYLDQKLLGQHLVLFYCTTFKFKNLAGFKVRSFSASNMVK